MANHAKFERRTAYLSGEFGESMARRYFGNELVDSMPRYVRGQRKGLLKGQIEWRKVKQGGFVITGLNEGEGPSGYVERRVGKVIEARLQHCEWGQQPSDVAVWEWSELYMNDRDRAFVITNEAA
jgi:hypothetical protein